MRERVAKRRATCRLFLGSLLLGVMLLASCKYTAKILPSAPSFLQANGVSSSQVNLAWRDNSRNEGGFIVERKEGPDGEWKEVTKASADLTKASDKGLSPGVIYYYRVRAFSSFGHSAYTNEAQAQTLFADTNRWYHTWGEAYPDNAHGIALDKGSNAYIAGRTSSFGSGVSDALVLKYSAEGDLLWQQTWGGDKTECAIPVAVGADGCAYVAGYTDSFGAGDYDCFLLKYSPDGTLLWQKTWGGTSLDGAQALCVDSAGCLYVAGDTESFGQGKADAFLLKYSPDGTLILERTWGSNEVDGATALCLGRDQTIILAGFASRTGTRVKRGEGNLLLLEYSTTGLLLAQRTWSNGADSGAHRLCMDDSGNLLVAGSTGSFDTGDYEALLLKFSPEGNLLWQTTWGGLHWESAQGVCADHGGYIYVVGMTNTFGAGWEDMLLLKYSPDGTLLKQYTWGGKDEEAAQSVCFNGTNALFIAGAAPDAYGSWYEHDGVCLSPLGAMAIAGGVAATPVGTETAPKGKETRPRGYEDLGGYSGDVLVMRLNTPDI
jgi:uncharacterized delta-60 repeat protein